MGAAVGIRYLLPNHTVVAQTPPSAYLRYNLITLFVVTKRLQPTQN